MPLEATYFNERIELLNGSYSRETQDDLRALSRIYNRFLGPVHSVSLHRPELLDLSIYCSSCNHSPVGSLMPDLMVKMSMADTIFVPGGGKGGHMAQAFFGVLGEIAERLLAVLHFESILDQLVVATYDDLVRQGRRALSPDELPLFAPEQYANPEFGYVEFHQDTLLSWIEGSELVTGDTVLVPAQLVLMYYKSRIAEAPIAYPTTGGLTFHCNRRRSILHGLYEVIERDSINVRWYCKLPGPRVDVSLTDFLTTYLGIRQTRMSTPNIETVQVFNNTLDIPIPVFTTIAVDRSRQQHAVLGGGGAWSGRERALAQALFELGQSRTALKFHKPVGIKNIRADSDISELTDFFDSAVYYGYVENLPRLSWYLNTEELVAWEAVPTFNFLDETEEYEAMIGWLRTTGLRPIVLDFSGACWNGVSITKVLIPQLTQACIPSHPYLGHPRFYELPLQLAMTKRRLEFRDLNRDPVPFP